MERVSIRITEGQKERWKRVADQDDRYQNLTHLIELAVQHELDGDWVQLSRIDALADNINIDTSGLGDSIDDIHEEVLSIREELKRIEAFGEVLERGHLRDTAMLAYEFLPQVSGPEELDNTRRVGDNIEEAARRSGNPIDIRQAVEANQGTEISESDIRLALDFLTKHYSTVESTTKDDFRLYYEITGQ